MVVLDRWHTHGLPYSCCPVFHFMTANGTDSSILRVALNSFGWGVKYKCFLCLRSADLRERTAQSEAVVVMHILWFQLHIVYVRHIQLTDMRARQVGIILSIQLISFLSLAPSLSLTSWALASCALMVEVTMATQWSCGPGCKHTLSSISPCVHTYSQLQVPPKSIILPDFDWHTQGGGRSQLVMQLISHNALQPLGTHCARS